jgi:hypothetical protein
LIAAGGFTPASAEAIVTFGDADLVAFGRLCLSEIKSGHIRDAIRRGPGGKECALPSSRCAIGARPYPRPSACASHYSSERKISESDVDQQDIETVWTAIALHTTPGIPQHMHPVVALVTAGVEMYVMGLSYSEYSDAEREAVVHAHPRTPRFKEDIIQAFYDGNKHKPETTFGNVNADVLADKNPHFARGNFCSVIRNSAWRG